MELEILSTKFIFQCQEYMYDTIVTHLMQCYMLALWIPHMVALGMELPDPICFREIVSYLRRGTWASGCWGFLIKWVTGIQKSPPCLGQDHEINGLWKALPKPFSHRPIDNSKSMCRQLGSSGKRTEVEVGSSSSSPLPSRWHLDLHFLIC